ncbi:hypothetical protein ADUPG1_014329 [Aduncisulcus paluster]|uniref:Uncharacterized protein n=12 Tax=Aduncisulcus paluster TaxID=2918883 RepID=A0ABQ5KCD0_9EUKA|nr:hypothetical protein ADUPG1_014329 [Aduncisulcus paluster]
MVEDERVSFSQQYVLKSEFESVLCREREDHEKAVFVVREECKDLKLLIRKQDNVIDELRSNIHMLKSLVESFVDQKKLEEEERKEKEILEKKRKEREEQARKEEEEKSRKEREERKRKEEEERIRKEREEKLRKEEEEKSRKEREERKRKEEEERIRKEREEQVRKEEEEKSRKEREEKLRKEEEERIRKEREEQVRKEEEEKSRKEREEKLRKEEEERIRKEREEKLRKEREEKIKKEEEEKEVAKAKGSVQFKESPVLIAGTTSHVPFKEDKIEEVGDVSLSVGLESDTDETDSEFKKRMDPNGFFEAAERADTRRATFQIGTSKVTTRCVAVGGRGSLMFCGNDAGAVASFEPDMYPLHEHRSYDTTLQNKTLHGAALLSLCTNHGMLASSDSAGIVRLWNEEDLRDLRVIKHPKAVYQVGLYDDCIIGCCKDNIAYMWKTTTGQLLAKLDGHSKGVYCCSRSGNTLITGSADHTVKSWDIERQELIGTVQKHKARVRCVATVHDGRVIASGGADKKIFFADKRQPKSKTLNLSGHKKDISFLHVDGAKIISASYDGFVRLWDIRGLGGGVKPACALKVQLTGDQILGASIDRYRVYCATSSGKVECIEF